MEVRLALRPARAPSTHWIFTATNLKFCRAITHIKGWKETNVSGTVSIPITSELMWLVKERQSVSQSVNLGFKPLTGTYGHILACKEYFSIVCRGASSLTGGGVCHVTGLQSLSVSCMFIHYF